MNFNRNTPYIFLGYVLLAVMLVSSFIDFSSDMFSSVGTFFKFALIYFAIIVGLASIRRAFIRDRGNFGHEYDEEIESKDPSTPNR